MGLVFTSINCSKMYSTTFYYMYIELFYVGGITYIQNSSLLEYIGHLITYTFEVYNPFSLTLRKKVVFCFVLEFQYSYQNVHNEK